MVSYLNESRIQEIKTKKTKTFKRKTGDEHLTLKQVKAWNDIFVCGISILSIIFVVFVVALIELL